MLSNVLRQSLRDQTRHYWTERNPATERYLAGRGLTKEAADEMMLGTVCDTPGLEHHYGWLSIPYVTAANWVVGFKFRRLDEGTPKYGSPAGQKTHLYNVRDILKPSDTIAVCEGELDTIICSQVLNIPAVGSPGVAAWKPHYSKLLAGYERVIVIGDNDIKEDGSNPGQEFARRVAQDISNTVSVVLPPGMDINQTYLIEGREALRERLGVKANE